MEQTSAEERPTVCAHCCIQAHRVAALYGVMSQLPTMTPGQQPSVSDPLQATPPHMLRFMALLNQVTHDAAFPGLTAKLQRRNRAVAAADAVPPSSTSSLLLTGCSGAGKSFQLHQCYSLLRTPRLAPLFWVIHARGSRIDSPSCPFQFIRGLAEQL
jgi:hypothetical protein